MTISRGLVIHNNYYLLKTDFFQIEKVIDNRVFEQKYQHIN